VKRFTKHQRRVLKQTGRMVHFTQTLMKRALDTHLRWSAMAVHPGRTPLAAVLLYVAALSRAKREQV
jgi:hypothetical protein